MHVVTRNVAQRLKKNAPTEFGKVLDYNRIYFAKLHNGPVNVKEYVKGEFRKYVN